MYGYKKQFRTERSDIRDPHEGQCMWWICARRVTWCATPRWDPQKWHRGQRSRHHEWQQPPTSLWRSGLISLFMSFRTIIWLSNYLNVIHFQDHRKSVMVIQWFISIILSLSCCHQNHQNHQQKNWAETEQDSELMFPHGTLVSLKT